MGSATTTAIVLVSILLFFSAAGLAYEVIVLVRSGATNSWRMYVKLTPYILTVFFQLMAISEFSMRNKYLICPYVTGTIITIVFFIVVGIIIGFSFSKYDELKSEGAEAELMVYFGNMQREELLVSLALAITMLVFYVFTLLLVIYVLCTMN